MVDPMNNGLGGGAVGAAPLPAQPSDSDGGTPFQQSATKHHASMRDQYQQAKDATSVMTKVRKAMDKITALGDNVTFDDLIRMSGDLVIAGLDPKAVAALIADAPQGGDALHGWLQMHDQTLRQTEELGARAHAVQQHRLGVAAIHELMAHHLAEGQGQQPIAAAAPASPNSLGAPSNA